MLEHEIEYERQQFKQMSFKEKLEHIFTYYKVELGVGLFLVIFLGWALIHFVIAPPPETAFNITIYAGSNDADAMNALEKDCSEKFPHFYDKDSEVEVLGLLNYGGEAAMEYAQSNEVNFMKFVGMATNAELDVVIMDIFAVSNFNLEEYFFPLDELFSEEELAILLENAEERVENNTRENESGVVAAVYDSSSDDNLEEKKPYFLCVGGNEKVERVLNHISTPYIGVMITSPNIEKAKEYIMYLMSE